MIDLLYLAYNRKEFTTESLKALKANTDWTRVRKTFLYDDGSEDGARELLAAAELPVETEKVFKKLNGPVAVMNDYLRRKSAAVFAKVDNDVILPPRWLEECLSVMDAGKELGLLGIEAFFKVAEGQAKRSYVPAKHIGGIGLMRSACFKSLPKPNGRFGFTAWQMQNKDVVKGWLNPSLPVILMDRLPMEPWRSLSTQYRNKGWQRTRDFYGDAERATWEWWMR